MSKKAFFYITFFVALSVAFYFSAVYFIPDFNNKKPTPIGIVKDFSFTTQDGKPFTKKDIDGKIAVVEYFFTTCKGICPVLNTNLRDEIYNKYKDVPNFIILSHTCDPENDSVPVIKRYADSLKVNTDKWVFLTGRKDSLYNMARYSYKIDDPQNNISDIKDDFLHTQFWALVNPAGEIIGVYDGLKKKEINQLKKRLDEMIENK